MVHRGFLQTWRANKFNERVLARILEIVSQGKVAPEDFQVFLTGGHSALLELPFASLRVVGGTSSYQT